jgi:23S rRNA (guanosine2251-2'-O)-methyltransferase
VVARIRLMNVTEVDAFTEGLTGAGAARPARVIALDGVTNPQNIGMIVRSAAAAGMDAILWPGAGSPWVSGLIIKASAATVYRFPIVRCHTLAEGLYELKAAGFTLFGLASGVGGNLFDLDAPHRAAFVVGSETEGLSPEIDGLMDERLSIPMAPGVESLNVAAAATLVCFAATGGGKKVGARRG